MFSYNAVSKSYSSILVVRRRVVVLRNRKESPQLRAPAVKPPTGTVARRQRRRIMARVRVRARARARTRVRAMARARARILIRMRTRTRTSTRTTESSVDQDQKLLCHPSSGHALCNSPANIFDSTTFCDEQRNHYKYYEFTFRVVISRTETD